MGPREDAECARNGEVKWEKQGACNEARGTSRENEKQRTTNTETNRNNTKNNSKKKRKSQEPEKKRRRECGEEETKSSRKTERTAPPDGLNVVRALEPELEPAAVPKANCFCLL